VNSTARLSLLTMLELHASSFVGATVEMGKIRQIMQGIQDSSEKHNVLAEQAIQNVLVSLKSFRKEAENVGARLACVSADRIIASLSAKPCNITLLQFSKGIDDIESRFADHLSFIRLYVMPESMVKLTGRADTLLNPETAELYTSLWFDCEEAAKCLCFGRFTACVFHSMRMLEVAISSIAKRLSIPDPSKADRSWGNMLNAIKMKMDELYPKKSRTVGCEGGKLEELYVTLDAAKGPWRNGTMHVDSVYNEEQAHHILACTSHLLDKMAAIFDQNGSDAPTSNLELLH